MIAISITFVKVFLQYVRNKDDSSDDSLLKR